MFHRIPRSSAGSSGAGSMIFLAAIVVTFLLVLGIWKNNAQIDDGEAIARFKEISGSKSVEIVRRTNNHLILGDPMNVTYELLIDEKHVSGKCTSGWISPLVCRVYVGE